VLTAQLAEALRWAAVRAARAPSIHNTQPWCFVLEPDALEIRADFTRRLRVLDPNARQLILSCGCAAFNARVALAALGLGVSVERSPPAADPDLLARIVIDPSLPVDGEIADLEPAINSRQTNRRAFADDHVPCDVVEEFVKAAKAEGAELLPIVQPEDRLALARLSQLADRQELVDPAYRAELRAWTTADSTRRDGVPASAVPRVGAGAEDDLPIRDFDTRGAGELPTRTRSSSEQCLLLLGTVTNDATSWLRAGEALERVLLEIEQLGYAASPFTQLVEVAQTNALLRHELRLTMHPHILLRVGKAPRTPQTRRRHLVDVLTYRY
jgi:hypothetical protein